MSRIGFKVINVPDSVTVTKEGNVITVKGPKGELSREFSPQITFEQKDGEITVSRSSENDKALHGTSRANLASMIEGVVDGYKKNLKLIGVGYRAQAQGNKLVLNVGYSHPVEFETPEGITVKTPSAVDIEIEGISKQVVGQFAAEVRAVRPPEPYKGKGIRYVDEYVRRKEGKTGK
ncbi:50S ribosomal protein L6 [Lactobacillus mulieris]|uniref:50S ribosomal protein L6 n=1 Tax=Lactobacillus mulieris TaxID=2508708 RepID=UPI002242E11A|nr:50S ribosomal protein L6 [Lactobacillus mulieris]MCW8105246.1 50S ribosomal protein L6 [Lactobacillus mulieris]MDK7347961.1 50S ribosomal protein L6 [Lactobacillus mulieris]